MKNSTTIFILSIFSILWICKPIPYESVSHLQDTHYQDQKIVTVLQTPSGGGQDDKRDVVNAGFVPGQKNKERPNKPDPQPKTTSSQIREQDSPNINIRYATPGGQAGWVQTARMNFNMYQMLRIQ